MLWINEGFVLDDAGNVLTTSYIDLREKDERPRQQNLWVSSGSGRSPSA